MPIGLVSMFILGIGVTEMVPRVVGGGNEKSCVTLDYYYFRV